MNDEIRMNKCRTLRFVLAAAVFTACFVGRLAAEDPLFLQEQFDRITLDAQNGNAVLLTRPLSLPGRRVPLSREPTDKLTLTLLDRPDRLYEVEWRSIKKVEFFEEMLLVKAKELTAAGNYDEAYSYFRNLLANFPKTNGLAVAYEACLFAEAGAYHRQGRFDNALAILRELHRRNPKYADVQRAMSATTDKLVEQLDKAQDYPAARQLIRNLAGLFADDPAVGKWQSSWKQKAEALQKESKTLADEGEWRKADESMRKSARVWPQLPGAKELAKAIHSQYPRLVVAVSDPARAEPPGFDDWRSRRLQRLCYRMMAELEGADAQGCRFVCPVGEWKTDPAKRILELKIRPDQPWAVSPGVRAGSTTATAHDAARSLSAQLTEPFWRESVDEVSVLNSSELKIRFTRFCPRPETLLAVPLLPYNDPSVFNAAEAFNGPFLPADSAKMAKGSEDDGDFVANPLFSDAKEPGRPREIVERRVADSGAAISALREGRVHVIDRLSPWLAKSLAGSANVKVQPYALPLVHCLVPNNNREVLSSPTMRRALLLAIDREAILSRLTGGQTSPGSCIVSGPFPKVMGPNADASPGYDSSILPRPYDPRLAIVLLRQVLRESRGQGVDGKPTEPIRITIAYADEPIARTACEAIRSQTALVGIDVSLVTLDREEATIADLYYMQLPAWEPVGDASRFFGRVLEAPDAPSMRLALKKLHREVYDETTILPLYQLTDYFAYHASLKGVNSQPVTLYHGVEQWRLDFHFPEE